jgi:hypothetical protein
MARRTRVEPGPKNFGNWLVRQIEAEVDFLPIVRTALLDLNVATPDRAMQAVDAFLQWFSMIPVSHRIEHYVMLRGDVDRLWHSMILHTGLYRDFCDRYIGRFVDHHSNLGCPRANWVLETVALIEGEFSAALHPFFLEWRAIAQAATDDALLAESGRAGMSSRESKPRRRKGSLAAVIPG